MGVVRCVRRKPSQSLKLESRRGLSVERLTASEKPDIGKSHIEGGPFKESDIPTPGELEARIRKH